MRRHCICDAYPIETVVAEKFYALVVRGITNSRLKDCHDLRLIADTFELNRAPLATALRQTFPRHETALRQEQPTGLSEAYVEAWGDQWRSFLPRADDGSARATGDGGR